MRKTVKTNLFFISFLMTHFFAIGNGVTVQYIQKYKTIAISEMQRTGIPASIKIAQGILESNSGRSTLAKQSNNHFGIKCGNDWDGKQVYRHDDDYENGLLVRSCFRAYEDPYDSYIAHSDFLSNPNSQRYGFLFNLDQSDYKAWAYGLKESGYATDANYPHKLINIIEKYQLSNLDEEAILDTEAIEMIAYNDTAEADNEVSSNRPNSSSAQRKERLILNRIKRGTHRVESGEYMSDIALLYKMDVRELYFKNRIPYGSEPVVGTALQLEDYIQFKKRPRLVQAKKERGMAYLFEEKIVISSE